jgi:hypothetical protein
MSNQLYLKFIILSLAMTPLVGSAKAEVKYVLAHQVSENLLLVQQRAQPQPLPQPQQTEGDSVKRFLEELGVKPSDAEKVGIGVDQFNQGIDQGKTPEQALQDAGKGLGSTTEKQEVIDQTLGEAAEALQGEGGVQQGPPSGAETPQ